jgi:hypothetical protein
MQGEKRRLQDLIASDPQTSDLLSAELLIRRFVYYFVNKNPEIMKPAIIGSGNIGKSVGAWASGVGYGADYGTSVGF